jgi:choline kinase
MKLFIAVPAKDQMYTHTAFCIQELVKYCTLRGIEVVTSFNLGTLVCNQREVLAEEFLESGADYILWIDSDMMFPPDVFKKLKNRNVDIVACTYSTRALPFKGVAYSEMNNWQSWISSDSEKVLEIAEGVGMGMMLCSKHSVESVAKPRFQIKWVSESEDYMGEDFFFCKLLRNQGFNIHIDIPTSKEIYHIGTFGYGFSTLTSEVKDATNQ